MGKTVIVANWKSNMELAEADTWLRKFHDASGKVAFSEKEVIICPPFTVMAFLAEWIKKSGLPISLGAQNLSPFPKGAYTGEVSAEQVSEIASYVLIGHSERRKYFHEDDQMLQNKVDMALASGLQSIFCVQGVEDSIPKGVVHVAYEPVFAIGTGEPDSPENAGSTARSIKETFGVHTVLYGGSVTAANVHSFTSTEDIHGVLVGSASLDPEVFSSIVANA